jgi:glyoxylase-like metal-dependent hydrolase (beta-lactamase superfamily II)
MLKFYILSVGHGSSIIVELENQGDRFFGLIDSNAAAGSSPRALIKLNELGAKRLSFLCLTHPHRDHFSGLYDVVLAFGGMIDHFYSCPMGDLLAKRDRLKKFALKLKRLQERSDSADHRYAAHEFLQILRWADTAARAGQIDWFECAGDSLNIAPPGFSQVEIVTMLPPNRAKGDYIQQIEQQDTFPLGSPNENEISLAIQFAFSGIKVVLGGDGTKANWEARKRYEQHVSDCRTGCQSSASWITI